MLDLADGVHSERTRTVEPELVTRPAVEHEERVAVAGGAVTEPRAFGERSRAPGQLAARERKLEIEQVLECRHHPGSAVAPLHADLPGLSGLGRLPVCEPVLAQQVRREVGECYRASIRERADIAGVAVCRT